VVYVRWECNLCRRGGEISSLVQHVAVEPGIMGKGAISQMVEILLRNLRVRDDGTGKGREINATYAEFQGEDAIVFLGDPGMGKTTFFKAAANGNFTTVRQFLVNPHVGEGEALFLDALDEYRAVAGGSDVSSEVAKVICSLKKPKFRLSCRSADWFGSTDQEVIRAASASGRVVVLELCPLRRDEILISVQGIVPDPIKFVDEAESAGLGNLLGNPQTLELLARAWSTDHKPRNKYEAYEMGVSELLKEINPGHIRRGATSPVLGDLRKAAGATSSILLLSNAVGVSRSEMVEEGYIALHIVPHNNKNDLDVVLKRRLFSSPGVDRFEPLHRTIAEFLAAEDLAARICNGLPIDRVMALMCGIDGSPISSLRGLFAWLMCRIGQLAEGYVERDPYGVATYGDASELSPGAQRAIWEGLRRLRDPWFLSNQDDHGSFRDLSNLNTAKIIQELLKDSTTGIHLKIAVLQSISNSSENIGLYDVLRDMVLAVGSDIGLRSTALRAFARTVDNDFARLSALDYDLAQATNDLLAPEVRIEILSLTRTKGNLAEKILSILEQAALIKKGRHVFGHFYNLIGLPSVSDLDEILDGGVRVLIPKNEVRFELRSIFDKWLKRRLESPTPISPVQMAKWLRNSQTSQDRHSEETLASLKERFGKEPSLFEEVFELLARMVPEKEHSFGGFVSYDLWKLLPDAVWPVSKCEFFLACAEREKDPARAGELFRMYLSCFPIEGASVALAEAGFEYLGRRHDVEKALGNWKSCKIEKWRKNGQKRMVKEDRKNKVTRAKNVVYLLPRLAGIRSGGEEDALVWASKVYLGYSNDKSIPDPHERLTSVTNNEITEACIEGFICYVENPSIPKRREVIDSWQENSIPYTHLLLVLSVFMRIDAGLAVPAEALPHCFAAVVTEFHTGYEIPGFNETMSNWVLQLARQNSDVVRSVLNELWVCSSTARRGSLPGFYELSQDSGSLQFLASLSVDVLKSGIHDDDETVGKLVLILLHNDQQIARAIGDAELSRNDLSAKVRAIWCTVLFIIDPFTYSETWKALMSEPDADRWKAIEVIKGAGELTPAQRAEVIVSVGQKFTIVGHPSSGWVGGQNPWDASDFVSNQIVLLAADTSAEAGAHLERLESYIGLECYRDSIRHHKAQHAKQQRESNFTFATPEQVAEAICNRAPATSSDLLAFVVDHLSVLSRELRQTQRERFRAYWNEVGKKLLQPKCEEVCSGFLAEDLQNRVKSQNLIVTVEHHMVADKECDLMVLQGTERLLPIEIKHHYHKELWTAWRTQLDRLYTCDAKAGGLGIYLILWSGEAKGRMMPKLPDGIIRPARAVELSSALESLIPVGDRCRIRVIVVDVSEP
jgi:hypothetical protein